MIKKFFCVFLLAVGFSMWGVAEDSKVPGFQIKNDPLILNTHDKGNITFEYGGTSLLSSIFLGVHWEFSQCNEGQVKELAGSQTESEVKIKGKLANAAFYESIKKVEKGFEVSYDISLDADNPFSISRHWELYPWFSDEHLERMKDCNYTFEDAAGIHKGALKDLIQSSQTVKSFTIHNYLGRDIRMEFPGGAALVERRTEKPSSGIWFFVHAVNENGEDFVHKNGARGTIRFNIFAQQSGEAAVAPSGKDSAASSVKTDGLNLLDNPSFELETNPGYADVWGPFYFSFPPRGELSFIENWDFYLRPVSENAFHGKKSLRIIALDSLTGINVQHTWIREGIIKGKEYVFSVYLKSMDKCIPKVKLCIRQLPDGAFLSETVTPTAEWVRYSLKFKAATEVFQPWIRVENGVVWIDAAKLETGSQPTPFTSDEELKGNKEVASSNISIPTIDLPEIESKAPVMDGTLNDPFWAKAKKFTVFHDYKENLKYDSTEAYIGTSGTDLYVGFICKGKNNPPLLNKRDDVIWNDDSVEIFLNTNSASDNYYHIAINNGGTVYDVFRTIVNEPFDCKIETKAIRTDDSWSLEAKIPISSLNMDKITKQWKFNLCRNDNVLKTNSSVFPIYGSFHNFKNFGKGELPENVYMKTKMLTVKRLSAENSVIAADIENSGSPGEFEFTVKLSAGKKAVAEKKVKRNLNSGRNIVKFEEIAVPEDLKEGVAELDISRSGETYAMLGCPLRNKGLDAKFQYNYYMSGDPDATLYLSSSYPATELQVEFRKDGKSIRKPCAAVSKGLCRIDVSDIPEGNYQVALISSGKELQMSAPLTFKKIPLQKEAVRIDQQNNILVVDRKPLLVNSTFTETFGNKGFLILRDMLPALLNKSGFNAITISVSSECENQWERDNQIYNPDKLQEVLDAFWKQSVKVMIMNSAVRSDKNIMPGMSLPELVNRFKTHPAILCWYISDEPYSQAEIKKAWDRAEIVRAADPYHPTLINLVPEAFGDGRLLDPATGKSPMDIFSLTYYPVGCKLTKPRDKNLKYGDMIFEKLGNIARSENKVVMHASQAYGYGTDHWEREPTPQEAEYLIYMPLIFGNRGYMWFGGRPKCRALWEKIIQSNSEMDLLTPVLCDEKISGDDVFKSLSGKAFGIMRKHKGEYWFISTSKSENTVAETFEFNNLVPAEFNNAEVEVMFENRKLKLKNGVLSDAFPSYGRHVYRIANKITPVP